jgi:hypothetical protein
LPAFDPNGSFAGFELDHGNYQAFPHFVRAHSFSFQTGVIGASTSLLRFSVNGKRNRGEIMLVRKLNRLALAAGLLFALICGGSAVMYAQKGGGGKNCYDYDRKSGKVSDRKECVDNVPTPEPVSILLFSAGLAGVGFAARRRLRRTEEE